jgi:pentatricopeptide repeat protein
MKKSLLFTLYYGVQSSEYHIMMSIYMMNSKIRKVTDVWNEIKKYFVDRYAEEYHNNEFPCAVITIAL